MVRQRTSGHSLSDAGRTAQTGRVIAEVSAALRGLYGPLLPSGVPLRFGPPTDASSALSVFLAAVDEDPHAVPADWVDVRDDAGRVLGRQPPIRRFDLTYLVSAWAKTAEAEEALLDLVLAATVPTIRLDPALLGGTLRGADEPVLIRLATDAATRWSDLGLPPHTVLGLTVNAPLIRPLATDLAPAADQITLGVQRGTSGAPTTGPALRPPGKWRSSRIDEDPVPPAPAVPGQPGTGTTSTPTKERHATGGQAG